MEFSEYTTAYTFKGNLYYYMDMLDYIRAYTFISMIANDKLLFQRSSTDINILKLG